MKKTYTLIVLALVAIIGVSPTISFGKEIADVADFQPIRSGLTAYIHFSPVGDMCFVSQYGQVTSIKKQFLPDYWRKSSRLLEGAQVLYCWQPGNKLLFWVTAPQLQAEVELLQAHFYGE